jgi:hypothetical protein
MLKLFINLVQCFWCPHISNSADAIMVDLEHWRCGVCSFSGKFGAGDTIAKHMMENKDHVRAAIAAEDMLNKGPKQSSIQEAWQKGPEKGKV